MGQCEYGHYALIFDNHVLVLAFIFRLALPFFALPPPLPSSALSPPCSVGTDSDSFLWSLPLHLSSASPEITGSKEMENEQDSNNMMRMFERMLQEQRVMSEVVVVVERLMQRNGQFNGKDVSRYLRDYKAEMMWCRISKELQVTSFNRVATDGPQGSIQGIRQQNPARAVFEEVLKTTYAIEDSSKEMRRGFED